MKILINTASSYKGGGIQVAKSYIEEFKKFSKNEYYVVLSKNVAKAIEITSFPNNFQFYKAPFRPATKFLSLNSLQLNKMRQLQKLGQTAFYLAHGQS